MSGTQTNGSSTKKQSILKHTCLKENSQKDAQSRRPVGYTLASLCEKYKDKVHLINNNNI